MIDVGHKLIMYGDAQFIVVLRFDNFEAIPEDVFPTSRKRYWNAVKKDKYDKGTIKKTNHMLWSNALTKAVSK